MNPMQEIEETAKRFAAARDELASRIQRLKDEQETIKRRLLQGIRNALARFRDDFDQLKALVEANPQCFQKPKTKVLHGIKVGWMKQRGKIEIADAETTLALIRKLFPEQVELLIRTHREPNKPALSEMSAKDLKRLAVTVTEDSEKPVVKPVDGDLDKLINALLQDDDLKELAP